MMRLPILCSLLFAGLLATGCSSDPIGGDVLTGKVTLNGAPAKNVTVTVAGADGLPANAATGDDGVYSIPNPPQGTLQVRVTGFVPTPPPGVKAPPPPPGSTSVPARYTKPNNGLSVEYTGGKQSYDIEMK